MDEHASVQMKMQKVDMKMVRHDEERVLGRFFCSGIKIKQEERKRAKEREREREKERERERP